MRTVALDPNRLAVFDLFAEEDRRLTLDGVLESTDALLTQIEASVATGLLATLREAAHRGRNEALAVGAGEIGRAFAALERSAFAGDREGCQDALEYLRQWWPPTREAIARVRDRR